MQKQLQALYQGDINLDEAYQSLYPSIDTRSLRRARFVKFRIILPEESLKLNLFLRVLFGLPVPVGLARFFFKKFMNKAETHPKFDLESFGLDRDDLLHLITYSKGITVKIESKDAIISLKIR